MSRRSWVATIKTSMFELFFKEFDLVGGSIEEVIDAVVQFGFGCEVRPLYSGSGAQSKAILPDPGVGVIHAQQAWSLFTKSSALLCRASKQLRSGSIFVFDVFTNPTPEKVDLRPASRRFSGTLMNQVMFFP